jgi:hypothetical protein
MRLTVILAIAAILTPAALTAHPAGAPGVANASAAATDLAAAKKKKAKAKKKTDEYLKAAPGAGPSGPPATKY